MNDDIRAVIDEKDIAGFRSRALTPDKPTLRGTAQNPDVYFQGREAVNPFYAGLPKTVQAVMDKFAAVTGRQYRLFDYYGDPHAEHVIVAMGSAIETIAETVSWLNARGGKVGVIAVRLFLPFDAAAFRAALPASVRSIAVLDRTKEPGSSGEPLFQNVVGMLAEAAMAGARMPRVVGGRYGLGSKEFTPGMVRAVFDNLAAASPKSRFTVGILDDVSGLSLPFDADFDLETADVRRCVFVGLGADGTVGANKNTAKIIGGNINAGIDFTMTPAGASPTAGFTGLADAFFGTANAIYSAQTYAATGGFNATGALRVQMGNVFPTGGSQAVSGAWRTTFTLATPATIALSFRHRLISGQDYDNGEYQELICDVDGTQYGTATAPSTHLAVSYQVGNGNGGGAVDSGWKQSSFDIPLAAGIHTLSLGGFGSVGSGGILGTAQESFEGFFDDVVLTVPGSVSLLANDTGGVAPVTAVIMLIGPTTHLDPLTTAFFRVAEITVGSLVGVAATLLIFPARAHASVVSGVQTIAGQLAGLLDHYALKLRGGATEPTRTLLNSGAVMMLLVITSNPS